MDQLGCVLANDVPEVKNMIRDKKPLFPEYTGLEPQGAVAHCISLKNVGWTGSEGTPPAGLQWQKCSYGPETNEIKWASVSDNNALYIWVSDETTCDQDTASQAITSIKIKIEPQRLYPARHFNYAPGNALKNNEFIHMNMTSGVRYAGVRIPFEKTGITTQNLHPVRIDVRVQKGKGEANSWRPNNPITSRLLLGEDNPADLGWLMFEHNPQQNNNP